MSKNRFNRIKPAEVRPIVNSVMSLFGQNMVLDLENSHGCYVRDSLTDREIVDLFSFFATNALGHNHPLLVNDDDFRTELLHASMANPSNSDFYTTQYANFIETFREVAMPAEYRYAFFISGGTLAVENGLKVAMDWKVKKNFRRGEKKEKGGQVIHFREAFHGRSGYCLSLTNTKSVDTHYFPKFSWPRIPNPKLTFPITDEVMENVLLDEADAIGKIMQAIHDNPSDICAIIIEPIQSEGGDNHFRMEFLMALRQICDEHELMLIFDEVQNGVGLTGKFWAYQHFKVVPDVLVFGKKMQTCGIMVTGRVDEEQPNCFTEEGRINSTWGGSLADMVRATMILRVIKQERLVENAAVQGVTILRELEKLTALAPITNIRGRGLQCAFDMPDAASRDKIVKNGLNNNVLLLPAGEKSIRFRPALVIDGPVINEAFDILRRLF